MTSSSVGTVPSGGRVLFFLILTTFFWGGSFLFTKIGLREMPPSLFVFFRFGLATLLMLIVCLPRMGLLDRHILRRGAIVGVALGVTNLTFVVGINGTSISRAGVINNLFVLFIPLISKALWHEKISISNLAGVVMAAFGIALLAYSGGGGYIMGDMVSMLCALFIAIHIITVSKVLKDEDVYLVSLVQFGTVTIMSGIVALMVAPQGFSVGNSAVISIAYCAIFPTMICFTLQNRYQRYVTPTKAGLIYTLDPVWSLMAGFLILGERLSLNEWIGCVLIFLAVLVPLLVRVVEERSISCGK